MFEQVSKLSSTNYLVILVIMQITILIFSLLGKFNSGLYFIMIRIIFLIMAQCLKQHSSASFYSILALMNGLYAFDPVGLFITGHGQKRTMFANVSCIIACLVAFSASYVGYLYKQSLVKEDGQNQEQGVIRNQFQQNQQYFNGNNTGYINPNNQRNPYSYNPRQQNRNSFQPFQGQGYSLS